MTSPLEVLTHDGSIPQHVVLGWMESKDLRVRAEAYAVTGQAWPRIQPELKANQQCPFMAAYLLECLRLDIRDDEYIHNGFEAAWELASWIKHIVSVPDAAVHVAATVRALESLFFAGDEALRNRIHVGVLEHALESQSVRPFFASWATTNGLAEIYDQALEWAESHEHGGT
jgi:hypothetical protein